MYEQDNIPNSSNESDSTPQKDTEYRYVKEEIPHRSYMDASFSSSSEGYSAPRSYYTPPEKLNKKQYKKDQRAAKRAERAAARAAKGEGGGGGSSNGGTKRWAVLVCACLVCALLGGLGGGAIVAGRLPDTASASPTPQTSGSGSVPEAPPASR